MKTDNKLWTVLLLLRRITPHNQIIHKPGLAGKKRSHHHSLAFSNW